MRLKSWMAALGVVALACTAPAAIAADINMSFRFNDPEAEEMRAALDAFEQENPGVEVELQTIAWGESRQQFLREAAVGEGPDVVHIAFVWPRDMGAAGALLPLNDFLETMPIQGGCGLETGRTVDTSAKAYSTRSHSSMFRLNRTTSKKSWKMGLSGQQDC